MKYILPLPETTNAIYKFAGKKMYKSNVQKQWEKDAHYLIKKQHPGLKPITSRVHIEIELFLKRDRDLDGSLKPLFDALQRSRIIENDNQVESLYVIKEKTKDNPRVEMEIIEL